jgi:hypothetical protein
VLDQVGFDEGILDRHPGDSAHARIVNMIVN